MTSKNYNKYVHAADRWLVQNAPKWVIDVVSEGAAIFKKLTNKWMYIGMIDESALYMIIRQCNEAPIQTDRIKWIRKIAEGSLAASRKAFTIADEDTFPTPHDSVKFLMQELHPDKVVEMAFAEMQRRKKK